MDTKTGIGAEKPPGRCSGQLQTHILLSKIQADDRALPRNQNHEQIEAEATQLIKAGRWRALFSIYTWGFFSWGKWDWIPFRHNPLCWNTHMEFAGGTFCLIRAAGGQQSSWPPLGALLATRAWEVHIWHSWSVFLGAQCWLTLTGNSGIGMKSIWSHQQQQNIFQAGAGESN